MIYSFIFTYETFKCPLEKNVEILFILLPHFSQEAVGEIGVINIKYFFHVCMFSGSQQVVQSHLGEKLWNVHSKQTSSSVSAQTHIPRQVLGLMGNFHG